MSNLRSDIIKRLKEGGWVIEREGSKHTVWLLPSNGARFIVNHHPIHDQGSHRKATMNSIAKLEKKP